MGQSRPQPLELVDVKHRVEVKRHRQPMDRHGPTQSPVEQKRRRGPDENPIGDGRGQPVEAFAPGADVDGQGGHPKGAVWGLVPLGARAAGDRSGQVDELTDPLQRPVPGYAQRGERYATAGSDAEYAPPTG